ncbi:MAG: TVP38/TMEM64 family protein [Sandaracinaceae bacterium]|nr:TVP38/TMEM64 family protein [Sandaracinaceae bacterium]
MPDEVSAETVDASAPAKRSSRLRLLALAAFFVGSLAIAKLTGLSDAIDVETIRRWMDAAGPLGFVGFVVAFAVGELMHVPGVVFVGAASVAYGNVLGSLAAYLGALASITASFYVVRTIGGQPLGEVQRPVVRKILARLDEHPIATIAILRFIFWMAPALNYGLAMSKVRFRDYFIGSALGLVIPIPLVVVFFDWVMSVDVGAWLTALF